MPVTYVSADRAPCPIHLLQDDDDDEEDDDDDDDDDGDRDDDERDDEAIRASASSSSRRLDSDVCSPSNSLVSNVTHNGIRAGSGRRNLSRALSSICLWKFVTR